MDEPFRQPFRLSRAQSREIDRRSIEDFHVPGIVLMENAARAVTDAATDMLRGQVNPRVLIVCGGGNNGGDGLAAARHLFNRGVRVGLALVTDPSTYTGDARVNWEIAHAMRVPGAAAAADAPPAEGATDLIIDAVFGTGLRTPPREVWPLEWMNGSGVPVLAADVPSGLDCDTGEPLCPACVRATRTVTFVAEKRGFANPLARPYLGRLSVGDIGCPKQVIETVAAT